MKRSKLKLTYHGRAGHPVIHKTKEGRSYIMVRATKAEGLGTRRLYLKYGRIPADYKAKVKHRR